MLKLDIFNDDKANRPVSTVSCKKVFIRLENGDVIGVAVDMGELGILIHHRGDPQFDQILKFYNQPLKLNIIEAKLQEGDMGLQEFLNKFSSKK